MLADGYMGEVNDTQKKSLKTIISATNRMNELISTLLNITRMETGTIAISPKVLEVDKVADEVIKELSLMAADKEVALKLKNVGPAPKTVKTDSLILKEVITNLASNAIKYTPEGGSITVSIKARTSDILVSVTDTGWGIPAAAQEQIFSKFFRAQNIVKRETTGTGLGLYLVKGLLDALGGKIWFKSAEGQGTTFYFTLPKPAVRSKKTGKKPADADKAENL
jgi:signal transduction histidine kinase